MFGQLPELHSESGSPYPAYGRNGDIDRSSLPGPDLKMNHRVDRHGNWASHPTASQGEILHHSFFDPHRSR